MLPFYSLVGGGIRRAVTIRQPPNVSSEQFSGVRPSARSRHPNRLNRTKRLTKELGGNHERPLELPRRISGVNHACFDIALRHGRGRDDIAAAERKPGAAELADG